MFTGCSSDDDVIKGNGNGTQNVYLKINLPAMGSANSRVISDHIKGGDNLQIASLQLAFTDANNRVMLAKTLTAAELAKETAANDSVEINNVSSEATKVFAIANSNVTIADGSIFTTDNIAIAAGDESDADAINIYGKGDIVEQGKDGHSYADITVYPTVSRFEVTDVTADGIFESFDVTGVYVDSFYVSARVNGDFLASAGDAVKDVTTDNSKLGTEYDPTWEGAIYNEGTWSTASGTAVAGVSKVWGYYVFATPRTNNDDFDFSKDPVAGTSSAAPRIILKIENIKVDPTKGSAEQIAEYEGKPWYVTAKSFTRTEGGTLTTPINSIVSGYVISTASGMFKVNEKNVHPNPNVGDVTVDVNITPLKWKGIEVVPNTK
jgi:hypothetical protein